MGEEISYTDGSYNIRAIVDGRYVVKIQNKKNGTEKYDIRTIDKMKNFDQIYSERDKNRKRSIEIYNKIIGGYNYNDLSKEYGIGVGRLRQIFAQEAHREKVSVRQHIT